MGGFGSGRHGGSVTAEGTASYIIAISSLRSFLQKEECLTGTISFNEGRFPMVITVDSSKLWDGSVARSHDRSEVIALIRPAEPAAEPHFSTTPPSGSAIWCRAATLKFARHAKATASYRNTQPPALRMV